MSRRSISLTQRTRAGYYRTMRTIITSDVHLGSRQCRAADFAAFLEGLRSTDRLVLNGDVVTRFSKEKILPPEHAAVLERLRKMSHEREIIWIRGNHDRNFSLQDPGKIRFVDDYAIARLLYIAHGDRFDHLMPSLRFVLIPLRVIYEFCTRFIGSRTHVTDFAKRFPAVYRILNDHVARNAITYGSKNGFQAVTCGHTHHPETRRHDGVRYFNTGCWTEDAAQMLVLEEQTLSLHQVCRTSCKTPRAAAPEGLRRGAFCRLKRHAEQRFRQSGLSMQSCKRLHERRETQRLVTLPNAPLSLGVRRARTSRETDE